MVLEQAAESYVVVRGGGHMSYIMVATTHEPTLKTSPEVVRNFVAALPPPRSTRAKTAPKLSTYSPNGCRAWIRL